MDYEFLAVGTEDRMCSITLDNEETLNALNGTLLAGAE